jgi:hypothetical protein
VLGVEAPRPAGLISDHFTARVGTRIALARYRDAMGVKEVAIESRAPDDIVELEFGEGGTL